MAARNIIVALDDSVHSDIAFKFFAENVYREGDVVTLVHCVEIQRLSQNASKKLKPTMKTVKVDHHSIIIQEDTEERQLDLCDDYYCMLDDEEPANIADIYESPGMFLDTMENVRMAAEDRNADSLQMVAKMKEMLTKRNFLGTALRVDGKAGEAIIRVSREKKADMIITGSRGHGIIWRTIFGSVSNYILHHSGVPVLICKH